MIKKENKKKIWVIVLCVAIVAVIFVVCLLFFFKKDTPLPPSSEGLEFELNDDESSYTCTGIGTCTETNLVIGSYQGLPVTRIDSFAFKDCDSLFGVTLHDGIEKIGENAFLNTPYYNNPSHWENGVLYMGQYLIRAKSDIQGAYDIKQGTVGIADYAFTDCTLLTEITLPESICEVGDFAFDDCSSLNHIYTNSAEISFGYSALNQTGYYNNAANWENKVLYLNEYLIKAQEDIRGSYTIKDGTVTIADGAFYFCSDLSDVEIPNTVKKIGEGAFFFCSKLTRISIPRSVKAIGFVAFGGCSGLTEIQVDKKNSKYRCIDNCVVEKKTKILIVGCQNSVIPTGNSVSCVGEGAFYGCSMLKNVDIPENITRIGYGAFSGCGLKNVVIPDSVTSLGAFAFQYCDGLETVFIGKNVTTIGEQAFSHCSSLTSVNIPDGVENIGNHMFERCESLTDIVIPDSVTSIGTAAFEGCKSLANITLPDSVASIGSSAFDGVAYAKDDANWEDNVLYIGKHLIQVKETLTGECVVKEGTLTIADKVFDLSFDRFENVTSFVIPDSVIHIGKGALKDCPGLISVAVDENNPIYHCQDNCIIETATKTLILGCQTSVIPTDGSVTSIGPWAFAGCARMKDIEIPGNITSIGEYAFEDCLALKRIEIPDSVTSIGENAFQSCHELESVVLPVGIQRIGSGAFWNCVELKSITIPDGVISMGDDVFYGCRNLLCVTIPNSITIIGRGVFSSCWELSDVYFTGTQQEWEACGGADVRIPDTATLRYKDQP